MDGAVDATDAALAELERLRERHGPLILVQSGGCCDGGSPSCLREGELLLGPGDLLLGEVGGVPFYVDAEQYERWNRPRFQLDLAPGGDDTFSLEGVDGVQFVSRTAASFPAARVGSFADRCPPMRRHHGRGWRASSG